MTLEYQFVQTIEEIDKQIQDCEGKHSQQVVYSTFHHALTQICWTEKVVRSNKFNPYEQSIR